MATSDVLSQLLGAQWRGISIPTLLVQSKHGHNIVPHYRVDRDGARVENTGQKAAVYTFKSPFINTIKPGRQETWKQPLYPTAYRSFTTALADRSSGTLVHPDYGQRNCKVVEWESTLDPDFRGGPTVVWTVMETVDDGNLVALASTSVQSIAFTAAQELDVFIKAIRPAPPKLATGGLSLFDFLRAIFGAIDLVTFLATLSFDFDGLIEGLDDLEITYRDEQGVSDNVARLISALHARKAALSNGQPFAFYIVPKKSSVAAITNRVARIAGKGTTVTDIYSLNPVLARAPTVPADTVIRYYR